MQYHRVIVFDVYCGCDLVHTRTPSGIGSSPLTHSLSLSTSTISQFRCVYVRRIQCRMTCRSCVHVRAYKCVCACVHEFECVGERVLVCICERKRCLVPEPSASHGAARVSA